MKRTASLPTSSTTSRKVTKSPERFDIFTGSPLRSSLTSWTILTSNAACPLVTAVIGAPDVDQIAKSAVELVLVIGDVGGEVGVAAVGLQQRPIDVVAKGGRPKQRLFAVLVIVDRCAFRRRQAALIDIALGAKEIDRLRDAVGAP